MCCGCIINNYPSCLGSLAANGTWDVMDVWVWTKCLLGPFSTAPNIKDLLAWTRWFFRQFSLGLNIKDHISLWMFWTGLNILQGLNRMEYFFLISRTWRVLLILHQCLRENLIVLRTIHMCVHVIYLLTKDCLSPKIFCCSMTYNNQGHNSVLKMLVFLELTHIFETFLIAFPEWLRVYWQSFMILQFVICLFFAT